MAKQSFIRGERETESLNYQCARILEEAAWQEVKRWWGVRVCEVVGGSIQISRRCGVGQILMSPLFLAYHNLRFSINKNFSDI